MRKQQTPRFIAIVTPGKDKRFRVFDRVSKNSYSATDDRQLAERLAGEYSATYAAPWYRRILAWVIRRPLPQPTPDPIDTAEPEPIPEWKVRFGRINALCEERKREYRLANGGRIVETDSIN